MSQAQPPTRRTKPSRLRGAPEPSAGPPPPPQPVEVSPALPTTPEPPPTEGPAQVHVDQAPPPPSVLPPGITSRLVAAAFKPPEQEPPTVDDVAKIQAQAPPEDPLIAGTPFRLNDVVQVNDPQSRHYGAFFVVADARHGKLHGWYMMEGLKKEFLTVPLGSVHYIGSAKVRTRVGCSAKWTSDNR